MNYKNAEKSFLEMCKPSLYAMNKKLAKKYDILKEKGKDKYAENVRMLVKLQFSAYVRLGYFA